MKPVSLLALAVATLAGGCMTPAIHDPARRGPYFSPTNYVGESSLGGLRRVVLLPIAGGRNASAETAATLDPILASALQQENRFEVVLLSREDCRRRFRTDAIDSAGAMPHDLMTVLRREFAADAVLFVDLTAYSAYRPLAIGLRAKLATLENTRLVWTFDTLFTANDPAVANAARRFYLETDRSGVPADFTPAALQSPGRFAAYATATMFATLPPVLPPPPPATPAIAQVR